MTKSEELKALADRCEREGPSWDLTCEIAAAIVPGAELVDVRPQGGSLFLRGPHGREWRPPSYTTSLDAAVTLVPESRSGCDSWCLDMDNVWEDGPRSEARISLGSGNHLFMASGNTPALALCAAALRARASLTDGA